MAAPRRWQRELRRWPAPVTEEVRFESPPRAAVCLVSSRLARESQSDPNTFEAWGGLATLHAVTRSVRDSAALLDATSGPALGDSYHAPHYDGSFLDEVTKQPRRLRIAMVKTMRPTSFVHPHCEQAVTAAAKLCASLGHEIEESTDNFNSQFIFRELRQAHGKAVLVALRRRILARLQELGREIRDDDLEPVTRFYFDFAERYTAVEIEDARASFFGAARKMAAFQTQYDVILTPTLALPPIEHGKLTLTGSSQAVLDGTSRVHALHSDGELDRAAGDVRPAALDAGRTTNRRPILRPFRRRSDTVSIGQSIRASATVGKPTTEYRSALKSADAGFALRDSSRMTSGAATAARLPSPSGGP